MVECMEIMCLHSALEQEANSNNRGAGWGWGWGKGASQNSTTLCLSLRKKHCGGVERSVMHYEVLWGGLWFTGLQNNGGHHQLWDCWLNMAQGSRLGLSFLAQRNKKTGVAKCPEHLVCGSPPAMGNQA